MQLTTATEGQLRAYAILARIFFPRRHLWKVFLLAFVGIHVPLLALAGYLLVTMSPATALAREVLLVALVATLVGSVATLLGLWVLLAPVAAASAALRAYQLAGRLPALPTTLGGEAGELLAHVQHTLSHLDKYVRDLAAQAMSDPLTGSPNRRAFEQRLAAELADASDHDQRVALVVVDVDGLKQMNDAHGHAAGDAALQRVALVLTRHFGEYGWVARCGGDEFVAIIREAGDFPAAEALLARVREELATAAVALPGGGQAGLQVSGGVARAEQAESPQQLFAQADADLYRDKRARQGASPASTPPAPAVPA